MIRISHSYEGKESVFETQQTQVLIGRPAVGLMIDLDLTPDRSVSRPHARLWIEDGSMWIEDLGSRHGTHVNGQVIKSKEKVPLHPTDRVRIGDTTIGLEMVPALTSTAPEPKRKGIETTPSSHLGKLGDPNTARRLALLYDFSHQLAEEQPLESLLQLIVERVVAAIPGAKRGALVLGDKLLLKAHHPLGSRPSTNLARKAMETRKAFIWPQPSPQVKEIENTERISASLLTIESAMYAPMQWRNDVLGVICVDNSQQTEAFGEDDLRFLTAIAHKAALAVANHQLQLEVQTASTLLKRMLTNFSPHVRDILLEEARNGRLRLGGKKSEVTILCADMRGFSRISATMEANDIVDMLNAYFSELVEVIFRYDGTIDKFIGDAILAVFGSPIADAKQQDKAVRAGLDMQVAMTKLNAIRREHGHVCCDIGVGIHSGEVMHGFIGSESRMEFTVIGDGVNQATRYCEGAASGEVLISPRVYEHVWKSIDSESKNIVTKHDDSLPSYVVKGLLT